MFVICPQNGAQWDNFILSKFNDIIVGSLSDSDVSREFSGLGECWPIDWATRCIITLHFTDKASINNALLVILLPADRADHCIPYY